MVERTRKPQGKEGEEVYGGLEEEEYWKGMTWEQWGSDERRQTRLVFAVYADSEWAEDKTCPFLRRHLLFKNIVTEIRQLDEAMVVIKLPPFTALDCRGHGSIIRSLFEGDLKGIQFLIYTPHSCHRPNHIHGASYIVTTAMHVSSWKIINPLKYLYKQKRLNEVYCRPDIL